MACSDTCPFLPRGTVVVCSNTCVFLPGGPLRPVRTLAPSFQGGPWRSSQTRRACSSAASTARKRGWRWPSRYSCAPFSTSFFCPSLEGRGWGWVGFRISEPSWLKPVDPPPAPPFQGGGTVVVCSNTCPFLPGGPLWPVRTLAPSFHGGPWWSVQTGRACSSAASTAWKRGWRWPPRYSCAPFSTPFFPPPWKGGVGGGSGSAYPNRRDSSRPTHPLPLPSREGGPSWSVRTPAPPFQGGETVVACSNTCPSFQIRPSWPGQVRCACSRAASTAAREASPAGVIGRRRVSGKPARTLVIAYFTGPGEASVKSASWSG